MKSPALFVLSLGVAFSASAGIPSIDELTETLSRGPWAELPVRAVTLVRHANNQDRKDMTIAAVKAALRLNPAAATAVVGSISRAVPAMAAAAAETGAGEQPSQASDIALAAAAANHAAAADIVAGVCRSVPDKYEAIAGAVGEVVPGSAKEILEAVETVKPELKAPIDSIVAQSKGRNPSVSDVLAGARPDGRGAGPLNKKPEPFVHVAHKPVDHGTISGNPSGPPNQYDVP